MQYSSILMIPLPDDFIATLLRIPLPADLLRIPLPADLLRIPLPDDVTPDLFIFIVLFIYYYYIGIYLVCGLQGDEGS